VNERPKREIRVDLAKLAYVMIAITIGIAAGRIAVVQSKEGDTAFLSANDRSRWCTVAALVEDGTYSIDRQIAIRDATGKRRPWSTIDRVRHTDSEGVMHSYSSKPPLFSTMVAGVYWLVREASRMTLTDQPIYVARIVIAIVNLPILFVFLVAVWRSVVDCYAPDSAKLLGLSVACFGTALLPMTISLNNHLPAAMSTAVVLAIYLNVAGKTRMQQVSTSYFVAGLAAAFTVANELPAMAMLVAWTILFFRQHAMATIAIFLPAAIVVSMAFMITNHLAHQSIRPPYMHRSDGSIMGVFEATTDNGVPTVKQVGDWFRDRQDMPKRDAEFVLLATPVPNRWIIETKDGNLRFALNQAEGKRWNVCQWDNWYDYAGSYWTAPRKGVDRGEASRLLYFFNITLGHYGLLSLTPIWLLVPFGLSNRWREPRGRYRFLLTAAIVSVSAICIVFYVSRPEIDRNYGGVSSSFRWMLWLTPLWIWSMMPIVTKMMLNSWGRQVVLALFVASVFSAATALDNPWQHPWIYRYLSFLGWLDS